MRTSFDQTIIQAIEMAIRNARLSPLFLGGTTASGGGAGSPPGGFIGYLPQTRVAYDLSELASSGISVSGSLLDNLNHIRYRINTLESGGSGAVDIYWNDIIVASGVTILNFEGAVEATDNGGGQVTILISGVTGSGGGSTTFLELTDTPTTYSGQTGKVVVVNGAEDGLEFTTISGTDERTKVSADDTTTNYLENKVIAGSNINITVLNPGANEQLEISSSGLAGSGLQYRQFTWTTYSGDWEFISYSGEPVLNLENLE